jgi:hypothetical protein
MIVKVIFNKRQEIINKLFLSTFLINIKIIKLYIKIYVIKIKIDILFVLNINEKSFIFFHIKLIYN